MLFNFVPSCHFKPQQETEAPLSNLTQRHGGFHMCTFFKIKQGHPLCPFPGINSQHQEFLHKKHAIMNLEHTSYRNKWLLSFYRNHKWIKIKQKKNFFTYATLTERIYLFLSRLASIHWWSSGGEGGEK